MYVPAPAGGLPPVVRRRCRLTGRRSRTNDRCSPHRWVFERTTGRRGRVGRRTAELPHGADPTSLSCRGCFPNAGMMTAGCKGPRMLGGAALMVAIVGRL